MRELSQIVRRAVRNKVLWIIIGILVLATACFGAGMKYQSHQDKTTTLAQNTTKSNKGLPPRPDNILHITGTISKIDGKNLEIKDETNSTIQKVCTSDKSAIQSADGKKSSLTDLKLDTRVRVTGRKQTDSCYDVSRLVVVAAKK